MPTLVAGTMAFSEDLRKQIPAALAQIIFGQFCFGGNAANKSISKQFEIVGVTRCVAIAPPGVASEASDDFLDPFLPFFPPLPLPPGWLTTARTPTRPVLLVDVEDAGHHLAALWSRRRRRQYRAAGWAFLDEDPDVFFRPPYVGGRGWIGVRLSRTVTNGELRAILEDAFRVVAPKTLVARLDGPE